MPNRYLKWLRAGGRLASRRSALLFAITILAGPTALGASGPVHSSPSDTQWWSNYFWSEPNTKVRGHLVRESGHDDALRLRLVDGTATDGRCLGTLIETASSANGYLLRFNIRSNADCPAPAAQQAIITVVDEKRLHLRAYSGDLLLVEAYPGATKPMNAIDSAAVQAATAESKRIDQEITAPARRRADAQQAALAAGSFEWPTGADTQAVRGLYNACVPYATENHGYLKSAPLYCRCIAIKFGSLGRLDAQQLRTYTNNFAAFSTRMQRYEEPPNSFYNHIQSGCSRCDDPGDQRAYCTEPDKRLLVANNYRRMIELVLTMPEAMEAGPKMRRNFVNDYLRAYGAYCRAELRDPVEHVYRVETTETSAQFGSQLVNVQEERTMLERSKLKLFKDSLHPPRPQNAASVRHGIAREVARTPEQLSYQIRRVSSTVEQLRERGQALATHLQGRCRSSDVQTVYKRLETLR